MTFYQDKDRKKFSICNKLISKGVEGSSSAKYALEGIEDIAPMHVNCGKYESIDIVGISVNGNRPGALLVDIDELSLAMATGVTFVKDSYFHTRRTYNTGERTVELILIGAGYKRTDNDEIRSIWNPKDNTRFDKHSG